MNNSPSLFYENQYWNKGLISVVGVDEVGRGCIAGPVVAAAVVFLPDHSPIPGINDSKKLTPKKRKQLDLEIRTQAKAFGIGCIEASVVDEMGIISATSQAMRQAIRLLPQVDALLIDGPLPLGLEKIVPYFQTIVKGDSISYTIAAASILAKVYRDRLMNEFAKSFPLYGWDTNKGYGTTQHYQAITGSGITHLHRKSFLRLD